MDLSIHRHRGLYRAALLVLATLSSAFPGSALHAEDIQVKIENFTFDPSVLTVKAGTTVKWENHDDIPHSIVEPAAGFRSQALDTDETYTFRFAKPGTYTYICGLHPQMLGKVIVTP